MKRFKILIQESSYGLKTALIPEDEWNDGNGDISVFFNRMDGEVEFSDYGWAEVEAENIHMIQDENFISD